jgi:hypothetical protein
MLSSLCDAVMMCFTGLTGAELASISNEAAIRAARRASTEVCIYTLTYTHAHTYDLQVNALTQLFSMCNWLLIMVRSSVLIMLYS